MAEATDEPGSRADAPKPPITLAEPAYAVLLQSVGPRFAGQVVSGNAGAIEELVLAGVARAATRADLGLAGNFIFHLPEA